MSVPLNWQGSYIASGGPLEQGWTHDWWATGVWGKENRFYVFSVFAEGPPAGDIEVRSVSHFRRLREDGTLDDQTHFEVHNKASDGPIYYHIYIGWSDPINV